MTWLKPLGFLGLIGIAILILIWILKPNFQQKFISSTYVWELSLKYKKKKIPINKLRNILLFLCQMLIISTCAFILAQPVISEQQAPLIIDRVAIIDASANMRTAYDQESRFERAVFQVQELAETTCEEGGYITVIFAGATADYIMSPRVDESGLFELSTALNDLVQNDACTFGIGDISGAIEYAQKIVDQNVDAEVYLYTATEYLDDGGEVTIVDVSQNGEWNAAILDCEALLEDNRYTFKVSVASYNRPMEFTVYCEVKGANSAGTTLRLERQVYCEPDKTKTVSFVTANEQTPVNEFDSVRVYITENDSFTRDNDFFIYGGRKPELNMLYFNPHANIFVGGAMLAARSTLTDWNINFKEINADPGKTGEEIPVSGYDFYVYEGTMPEILPTDGVVMLINMNKAPEGLTAVQGKEVFAPSVDRPFTLSFTENAHPITQYLNPERIEVTKYTRMLNAEGFTPLLYCNGEPVLFVKDTDGQKIVMMNFSVNYSMISMYVEFPMLMYNIIEYFLPSTLSEHAFDINETITLNARSDELSITSLDGTFNRKIDTFPEKIALTIPGSYTLSQLPISGKVQQEQFFVKIPSSESNISQTKDELYDLIVPEKKDVEDFDLLLYFAIALVTLVFFERWLQAKDM